MENNLDKIGVVAALKASNLKTLVKAAIKKASYRDNLESSKTDVQEAKHYLALYKERAELENSQTLNNLTNQITELETLIEMAEQMENENE